MRDYVLSNAARMRRLEEETMLQTAEQWDASSDYDVFGAEEITYNKVDTYPCGLKVIMVSERRNFTGVDETVDAVVRIPYDKISSFGLKSRLKIVDAEVIYSYEAIGPVRPGIGCGVVEMTKVQF